MSLSAADGDEEGGGALDEVEGAVVGTDATPSIAFRPSVMLEALEVAAGAGSLLPPIFNIALRPSEGDLSEATGTGLDLLLPALLLLPFPETIIFHAFCPFFTVLQLSNPIPLSGGAFASFHPACLPPPRVVELGLCGEPQGFVGSRPD